MILLLNLLIFAVWTVKKSSKYIYIYIYISLIEYNKNLTVYAGKKIILYTFHQLVK